jgi:hypothetical protein
MMTPVLKSLQSSAPELIMLGKLVVEWWWSGGGVVVEWWWSGGGVVVEWYWWCLCVYANGEFFFFFVLLCSLFFFVLCSLLLSSSFFLLPSSSSFVRIENVGILDRQFKHELFIPDH